MRSLSKLAESFTESVIREMARLCQSVGGYNLSQGFPDFESPQEIKDAAIAAINNEHNQYSVTYGEPELREAISKKAWTYNSIKCNPQTDITVCCGATEAMISALMAIINPGDEIIVFEPFYENYGPDSILSGATLRYVTLHTPDWSYSPDELADAFNEKTKAIIINTPHNPTGKVFSRKEMEEIAQLCIKWDCYAITDEIYEHILYDNCRHISMASIPGMNKRTITINSISKTYAVTGWRVGWAIADKPVSQSIRKVHDFLTVGAPNPFQHAAASALLFADDYYINLQIHYAQLRETLFATLQKAGFKPHLPQGAYYIFADMADLMKKIDVQDDVSFSRKLIDITGVATVPGSSFYNDPSSGKSKIRFCFCKKLETLQVVDIALNKLNANS